MKRNFSKSELCALDFFSPRMGGLEPLRGFTTVFLEVELLMAFAARPLIFADPAPRLSLAAPLGDTELAIFVFDPAITPFLPAVVFPDFPPTAFWVVFFSVLDVDDFEILFLTAFFELDTFAAALGFKPFAEDRMLALFEFFVKRFFGVKTGIPVCLGGSSKE